MNERDKLIKKLIEEKGGSRKDYLNLLDSISYHESAGTYDPTIKQFSGGPGRGKYQFEIGKNAGAITAARRTKNYYKENNIPVPEWLTTATSSNDLDVSKLTGEQQDILFLGNIRKHPKANFSNVWEGKESIKDFWANYHWAGKAKDRPARLVSFEESLTKLRQRGKTKERINNQPLYETTTTAVDNTAVRQPKVQAAPAPYYPPKQKQEVGHNTPNKQPELDFIDPRGHMDSIIDYMKQMNKKAFGGKLNEEECECGCPGKPPCPEKPIKEDNFKNAENLYSPLYEKIAKAYGYKGDGIDYIDLITDERIHPYVRKGLDDAFGYSASDLYSGNRMIPPINNKLDKLQKTILNAPDEEIVKLLGKDYRDANIFNMGSYLPDSVGIFEALGYAREFKKLRKKGYTFAEGGSTNIAGNNNDFNSFENGGTHEQNPHGGIPLGVGSNGKMNTVEEGEVSFDFDDGKYIFSNRY